MSASTRRFVLRHRTSEAHSRLDETVGPLESPSDYSRYLRGLARFRIPVELALDAVAWPAHWGGWRAQKIADHIHADMDDLGLAAPEFETVRGRADTDCREPSALLGVVYVLEGSMLGARVILEQAQRLGLDRARGARHLAVQAAGLTNWRDYLALLEREPSFDADTAVAASVATFRRAQRAFEAADHAER